MAGEPQTPGDRIRELRKRRGLSVAQLAPRTGFSESGVRAHENGQNGIRPDVAAVYARVLRVGPDWILYGTGDDPSDDEPPALSNNLRAWREFRGLTELQLAARADTTEAVILELEASNRPLSGKYLRQFAPALRTTEGLLAEQDPNELPAEVIELWVDIPEEKRPEAVAILRVLAGGKR